MSAAPPKSPWRKFGKICLILGACGVLAGAGLLWYITTDSFHNMVSQRLVAQLERITGGKAAIGELDIYPFQLRVDIRDLTIHGLEKPDEAPYLHIDRLVADLKLRSLFHGDLGFRAITIDHPTLHLEIYPDGTTNQPAPAVSGNESPQGLNSIQQLFSISVNRIDVRHGSLLLGNQQLPVDFSLNDFAADTNYSFLHQRYDSNILLGHAEVKFEGYKPIAWTSEVHFSVEHNRIELKDLKAATSGAHLEANGQLQNFLQPQVDVNYKVDADLARAASVVRRNDVRGGALQLSGQGSWSAKAMSATGNISIDSFAWRDANIDLRNARLEAKYSADRNRLTLSQLQAKLLGGSSTGDFTLTNWLGGVQDSHTHKEVEQEGTLKLKLANLSVSEIADALSNSKRPFDRIGLEGSTSGTIDTRWRGLPKNAEVKIAVDVAAPLVEPVGRIALDAHAKLTYNGVRDDLNVQQFDAGTRYTQLHASGALAQKSSLHLSASTTDLDELRPLIVTFGGPQKLPFRLDGRAVFDGLVTGRMADPALSGNVHATDFEVTIPATSKTPQRQVHWDELKADVQFSSRALTVRNGDVHHDAADINFDLNLGLQKAELVPSSTVSGHINANRADLAELLILTGYNYPVRGTIDFHTELSGTRSALRGQGNVAITNANAYGMDVQSVRAQFHLTDDQVSFQDIDVAQADQKITGSGAYTLSTRAFQFDLTGANINLASFPQAQAHNLTIEGRADFQATGSGTVDAPVINAKLGLHNIVVNGQSLGESTFEAKTQGGTLRLTGHSKYELAEMTTDGTIQLRNDWPCNIKLHFSQVNADPLLRVYMNGRVNSHSLIDGDLLIQGPLLRPRELRINGDFSNVSLGVGEVNIKNSDPIRFSIANQLLTIEPFHFTGERTDLSGNGTVELAGDRKLNLHTRGRVSLRLLESFNHDFTSSGIVTVDLNVGGTVQTPTAQGRFEIRNGSIAYIDLPNALSEINGTLVFNQDRVQIETLTAQTGGGTVQFQGYASTRNHQVNFDVNVHGDDVRLRYPPGISSTANMDLRFAGNSTASMLSGDVTITRLAMSQNFDFASYLAASSRSATLSQTDPLLNSIRLNVHIVTTPELQMQTTMLRLSGNADLKLRGTVAKPTLLGRADVTEGEIYFNGSKYHLERGEVSFRGPSGIVPTLDMQMSTRVREYDITVSLTGPPDKLKLQYHSEPPLPEADIVSLLALGRTREESAQQQGNSAFGADASNAILSQALNATVSSRVQNLFGGSRIKIDPQGLSTETTTSHGPQVTIEQQVTNQLTVTYSTNVSQSSQQIIQMEYNVSRNLSIVALRDQNGIVSFDVRIRQRKK
jgi:translocation and assembly module TamB